MAGRGTVVVIGLGRFGTAVAAGLTRRGLDVLAIDIREHVVQQLADGLDQVACADGTDVVALQQLGVPAARQAVVAISSCLEDSVLCTVALAELQIRQIWATAGSEAHAKILKRLGAHRIVMPAHGAAHQAAQDLASRRQQPAGYSGSDFAATAIQITPQTAAALAQSGLPSGAVAAIKQGTDIRPWRPGDALPPYGTLLIAGPPGALHGLSSRGSD